MDVPGARRRQWLTLLIGITGLVTARAARADLIYFRGGGDAQLPATSEGNRVVLILPDGKLELLREDIVEAGAGLLAGGRVGVAAARGAWGGIRGAIRGGLVGDRERPDGRGGRRDPRAARPGSQARPDGADGRRARSARPAVSRSGLSRRSARRWGSRPRSRAGRTSCCSTSTPTPRPRSAWPCWSGSSRASTCSSPPRGSSCGCRGDRLVSAWFADRKDYLAFLHRQGADAFATTSGYFHPTWDAVVACDARSGEKQRAARAALAGAAGRAAAGVGHDRADAGAEPVAA